ncbi:uncharacterized protein LOC123261371 [Cotesia glomerata]|uniref:uncharacterized protein LOC123261371 n=1 Tax=Cotesia glomerata TaxID=32391 RepID=UPI001D0186B9|nr:uncharacterized protein LOC123261371 [Cotesia glomerata]
MLQDIIDDIRTSRNFDIFIIGGDMNAKVGLLNPWPADLFTGSQLHDFFCTTDDTTCERGRRITDFMVENDFVLINGRSISDSPAQPTYDNLGSSIIDLVWSDISSLHLLKNLEVLLEPSLSDHHSVCLSISLEATLHTVEEMKTRDSRLSKIKWSESAADQYREHLSNRLTSLDALTLSTEQFQSLLHDHMLFAASSANLVVRFGSSARNWTFRNPWFDASSKVARCELRKAMKNSKNDRNNASLRSEVTLNKKKYREVCNAKKKDHVDSIKSAFDNVKAPSEFWAAVRKFSFKHGSNSEISITNWNNFYTAILKPRSITVFVPYNCSNEILDAEISTGELNRILNTLKSGKAAGPNLLTNELFKNFPIQHKELLRDLFNRVLIEERVPKSWAKIWMTMLHKKGDKNDPNNYRGIALINIITKIFTNTLKKRLDTWMDKENALPDS